MQFVSSATGKIRSSGPYYRWSQLFNGYRDSRFWFWFTPLLVTVVAAIPRFVALGGHHKLIFDETYYVKDSYSLVENGYESGWEYNGVRPGAPNATDQTVKNIDENFARGDTSNLTKDPSFLAHPPLGKFLIGVFIHLFGANNSFGWRFGVALCGTLIVLLTVLIGTRLFHSNLLGGVAGFFLAIDNNAIVMSRVTLLDGVLVLFIMLFLWFILLDRSWYRRRTGQWLAAHGKYLRRNSRGQYLTRGPIFWFRPWLFLTMATVGMGAAVKWNAAFYLLGMIPYLLISDFITRHQLGLRYRFQGSLYQGLIVAIGSLLTVVFFYVLSYFHYFLWGGYMNNPSGIKASQVDYTTIPGNAWVGLLSWVPKSFQNLFGFHLAMYGFNSNLSVYHPYEAPAWSWPLLLRPTNMLYDYHDPVNYQRLPDSQNYLNIIFDLPNPLLWWSGGIAFLIALVIVVFFRKMRDWRINYLLMGMAAGYFPWFLYAHRTIFQFYTIIFTPFMMLMIVALFTLLLRAGPGLPAIAVPARFSKESKVPTIPAAETEAAGERTAPAIKPPRTAWPPLTPVFRRFKVLRIKSRKAFQHAFQPSGMMLNVGVEPDSEKPRSLSRSLSRPLPLAKSLFAGAYAVTALLVSITIMPISLGTTTTLQYWRELMIVPTWSYGNYFGVEKSKPASPTATEQKSETPQQGSESKSPAENAEQPVSVSLLDSNGSPANSVIHITR